MSARDAARFTASRAGTFGLYALAVIGSSSWDRDPDSWFILVRIGGTVIFLWFAVSRTIRHYHEDREFDRGER
jgi:hypothetical protein